MYILPYPDAVSAFLAVFSHLPQPLLDFFSANFVFFVLASVFRMVSK